MSEEYWRAKVWGLQSNPILQALHNNNPGGNKFYDQLKLIQSGTTTSNPEFLQHILLADCIASASDRAAIYKLAANLVHSQNQDLQISHLLSGEKQHLQTSQHIDLIESNRREYLQKPKEELLQEIESYLKTDIENIKPLFWWLWRCLPEETCKDNKSLMLMPADIGLPDASIWSYMSIKSALAGALAGYDVTEKLSHPYLAVFSFSPVQELIKASRKMRDFWAGSWLLHYLSAKVCWKLAEQYGPDTLLYPSLYGQPLIDYWLREKYPELSEWVKKPSSESLLTAGFPNVLVVVLPQDKVEAAMQTAKQTLLEEWQYISQLVFQYLQNHNSRWKHDLKPNHSTWQGWLKSQWQFYWTALPIGAAGKELKYSTAADFKQWSEEQNKAYNLRTQDNQLFAKQESELMQKAKVDANVGSWWGYIFDATRATLASVKNVRNWELPTAFGPRSTISGIGPVVNPGVNINLSEEDTQKFWKQGNLFDGSEQLNATETVKRGLHKILPELLDIGEVLSYPDLTSGVAGYLKVNDQDHKRNFEQACQEIMAKVPGVRETIEEVRGRWGIPWIDKQSEYHPRLLNAGWLMEDLKPSNQELKEHYSQTINQILSRYYPNNNPSNWYVLAAGDGDKMSEWLKGAKLESYRSYIHPNLATNDDLQNFLNIRKRMGPSTHSALSRALLDFSNQLVPYLTQERYAGKLIYAGGDDVLSYINPWEWDHWLWDIRQCFRGAEDPFQYQPNHQGKYFDNTGDYWHWSGHSPLPKSIHNRPLFTMGQSATISFGVIIAHHSVPLAIALENLWEAEKDAKELEDCQKQTRDAVQVRVLYGNGNTLKSTAKFDVFHHWQKLMTEDKLDSAIFEQAASLWSQHPAPIPEAIAPWTRAFCDRRDQFQGNKPAKTNFQQQLASFLEQMFKTTPEPHLTSEVQNWLKLAAFVNRSRHITLGEQN